MSDKFLFNEKTIQRLVSTTNVSPTQKRASAKWLSYLKENRLENEKEAYIEFANTILRDLLGYDISLEGLKHEESHIEFLFKKDGNNLICFEVKGTKTKDLWAYQGRSTKSRETPVNQINSYMYEQKIPFGVLTNYEKFVLFDRNEGSKKYYSIDFTDLSDEKKLKEFVAVFSRKKVEEGFIFEIIEKSVIEEREFTKEFYKLFHETRLMLIKEFESNGGDLPKIGAVHFAQLFLNRLMFVFFAEDTGKLDKRTIEERILKTLDNIHLFSSNTYNISNVLTGLFKDLDKGSDFPVKLFGFNGGLFQNPIPPRIFFRDFREEKFFKGIYQHSKLKGKKLELNEKEQEIFEKYKNRLNPIIKNLLLMASFDFKSEVNVNILGHIFEQSISDIEDLQEDKTSRRKKEGIFYTPEYITDYICRNTIIPYLSEKDVNEIPDLIKEYSNNIEKLENKFKKIKILDPACGSGAFLIKATDVMLEIFKAVQEFKQQEGEYEAKRGLKRKSNNKGQLVLGKWDEEAEAREIIENSIYGVDINEESVEITKLALFLKMARRNRKLTNLSDNIKQGNSLIDDPEIAKELAFNWKEKFPEIMNDGGFDIVIGNPPYGAEGDGLIEDSYIMFYKRAFSLMKNKGVLGFITPDTWAINNNGIGLREVIEKDLTIMKIFDVYKPFEDAKDVWCHVMVLKKEPPISKSKYFVKRVFPYNIDIFSFNANQSDLPKHNNRWYFYILPEIDKKIFKKMEQSENLVKTVWHRGISPTPNTKNLTKEPCKRKVFGGEDVGRYLFFWHPKYLKDNFTKNKDTLKKLGSTEKVSIQRIRTNSTNFSSRWLVATYVDREFIPIDSLGYLLASECSTNVKYYLSVINSTLLNFYYKLHYTDKNVKPIYLNELPIPNISPSEQKPFIEKADLMLELNKEFYEKKDKFLTMLKSDMSLTKFSKKMEKFYELNWEEFEKELGKQKISLKGTKKDDWFDRFGKYKKELLILKEQMNKTDKEIDKMVYDLYGLNQDEIKIIEDSLKK